MHCDAVQESLSARQDGEKAPLENELVRSHLASCARCRSFAAALPDVSRALKVRQAETIPDLTAPILSAIGAADGRSTRSALRSRVLGPFRRPYADSATRGHRLLRWNLVVVALLQLALTAPQLLFGIDAMGAPYHVAQELGSLDAALGLGFLLAAARPTLASGMAVVAVAAAAFLILTAGADVLNHTTTISHEIGHLPAVIGSALVSLLARAVPVKAVTKLQVRGAQ